MRWTSPLARYYADCSEGTLPNIAFVDPPFRDGGGADGLSADEHPHGDVRLGQAWMADVVRAFVNSPNYRRSALFIVYDEWGGFFDHVRPPSVPDARSSRTLSKDFGQMGFRIPAVAVSPYTRRPRRQRYRVITTSSASSRSSSSSATASAWATSRSATVSRAASVARSGGRTPTSSGRTSRTLSRSRRAPAPRAGVTC